MLLCLLIPIALTATCMTVIYRINRGKDEVAASAFWVLWACVMLGVLVWFIAHACEEYAINDKLAYAGAEEISFELDEKDGSTYIVTSEGRHYDISHYGNATIRVIDPESGEKPHIDEYSAYGTLVGSKQKRYEIWIDDSVNDVAGDIESDASNDTEGNTISADDATGKGGE